MKKSLFIILAAVACAINAAAALTADWKIHMPFDAWPTQVVETPGRVYFMSRTFEKNMNLPPRSFSSNSLFYYDKEGDEIISLNERTNSNGNAVACIGYNLAKKYLLVVYTDCNMDFIYDDGRIFNLPALKVTSIPGKKEANSINFDNAANRAYVATSFGYVCLNDEKHEVAESRNYGIDIQSVAKCGSDIVLCHDNSIYFAPASHQRYNFTDYELIVNAPATNTVFPLEGESFVGCLIGDAGPVDLFRKSGNSYSWTELKYDNRALSYQQIPTGFALTGNTTVSFITPQGQVKSIGRPQNEYYNPTASIDGSEIWCLTERKGLRSYKVNDTWDFTLTRDYMRPNAPATYISSSLVYHPDYGMLAGSNGFDFAFSDFSQNTPSNISALSGGFWKEYGPYYVNPSKFPGINNFYGLAVDPRNTNYVYRGHTMGGLMRFNLSDPNDIISMAHPASANSSKEGFIKIVENQATWNALCQFTTPTFTPDGTMWTGHSNFDRGVVEVWYWNAQDRAATTSAATYRPMKHFDIPKGSENSLVMTSLQTNPNIIIAGGLEGEGMTVIYDHNGTPDVTSDDRYTIIDDPRDQDGGGVTFQQINKYVEDPETGLVWILTQRGAFTINPKTIFEKPNVVNRIKINRNDGTNLADYLLNEVNVTDLSFDNEGRKWFSTGNGIVCTSSDSRTILGEFTTENSYLPDDNVYVTCYNPENNSIVAATGGGLVELFPSGGGNSSSGTGAGVRAYPNPVEPDYYGWVRIDNLADGSLVKIADAKGGIVKELGPAQGGSVEWDVSGLNNTRVSTGVYYIMVSPGANGGNTEIQKILVLN